MIDDMREKIYLATRTFKLIFLASVFVAISFLPVAAQVPKASVKDQILPPSQEKFQERDQLVSPWRESGCDFTVDEFNQSDCYRLDVHDSRYDTSHILTLYDDSGLIWYRFSILWRGDPNVKYPIHFTEDPKIGFLPFSLTHQKWTGIVILRMVGESPHWYKVEVNENTQATQYVLKSDPMWVKKEWSYWLYEGLSLKLGENNSFLFDKPNGKIIEETTNQKFDGVQLIKVEGDWAYVKQFSKLDNHLYKGWVRWRKGRDLLVGCILNDMKVPETKIDAGNN